MVTFKAVHNLAPDYLCDLIVPYNPARSLRSESKHLLSEQSFRLGGRALSPSAPRSETDLDTFKRDLKTFIFQSHFKVRETVVKALYKFKFQNFIHVNCLNRLYMFSS
jgi:hypothetical protein